MHILVAFDGSDPANAALEYALSEHADARLTVLHVIDPYDIAYAEGTGFGTRTVLEMKEEVASELLEEALETAADHDGPVTADTVVGKPARELVAYADEHDVDHVVVGSHGRSGASRVLLGSVAEAVARRAPAPVTIVR